MKKEIRIFPISLLILFAFFLTTTKLTGQTSFAYHDAREFLMIGKGFQDTEYSRLPLRYKNKVRPELWDLSINSSGIAIRFATNSSIIAVKWKTGNTVHSTHVAGTLVKGVDLYCMQNDKWYYAGVGKPYQPQSNQAVLVSNMDTSMKQFILYLPMYETVDSIFIGINPEAEIKKPEKTGFRNGFGPVVFYGTSITQGASAMRPGMAYPSIISRDLSIETINLGFSGNGLLEQEVGEAMVEISASCYVIDCGPNLDPQLATERTIPFIRFLRKKRPHVPILLIEKIIYPIGRFDKQRREDVDSVNQIFKKSFATLKKEGVKSIYYLSAETLIGTDGEATVDGIHLTDLGFMRIAHKIEKHLKKILKL